MATNVAKKRVPIPEIFYATTGPKPKRQQRCQEGHLAMHNFIIIQKQSLSRGNKV